MDFHNLVLFLSLTTALSLSLSLSPFIPVSHTLTPGILYLSLSQPLSKYCISPFLMGWDVTHTHSVP